MKRSSCLLYFFLGSTVYALYNTMPEPAEVAITADVAQGPVAPGEEYKNYCQADPLAVSCAPEF